VRKYLEFVRFSHTVFALPFALAAMSLQISSCFLFCKACFSDGCRQRRAADAGFAFGKDFR